MLRVARYRFQTTFRHRWAGYATLVLLIGLVGGLALGVFAAARRTQSSFPRFLASTNPSDVNSNAFLNPTPDGTIVPLAHIAHVKRFESQVDLAVGPIRRSGAAPLAALHGKVVALGSIDGLGFDQDRVSVVVGRMADPKRADEFVMTKDAAHDFGLQVGDVVPIGAFTTDQIALPDFGTPSVQPHLRMNVRLVGLVVFNNAVIQDDIERIPTFELFTPAFTRKVVSCCAYGAETGLQLDRPRQVAVVEAAIERALPEGAAYYFQESATVEAKAQRAIRPEVIALGVFGAITALAALLIAAQVIGRQLRLGTEEAAVLRALGAGPVTTAAEGLLGTLGAVVLGSLVAAAVAVGLSPLAPLGPVRPVDPAPGIAFDPLVLGLGVLVSIAVLSAAAVAFAFRNAPHRLARRVEQAGPRGPGLARAAANSGLPIPAVTGIRFALETGRGRNTVPVRSAMLGAALAIVVVTGTVTFGASLNHLVSHPALYGWNWSYELDSNGGGGNIPEQQAARLLAKDRYVAAWTGVYFDSLRIDGQTVPVMLGLPRAPVGPPVLSGHAFDAVDQIVFGPTTLAQLHKRVGDTVEASYGAGSATRLRIVGTATMPAIGPGPALHLSMGTGALTSYHRLPPSVRNGDESDAFLPNAILVRLRSGADPTTALRSLQRITNKLDSNDVSVQTLAVQRPAEIVNYRSMGDIPAFLGAALGVGAVVAMMLTLIATVRRRRHDLALLKTLGFTRRQLAAVVAWQSSVAVAIGIVVGIPIGIILGRWAWDLFARTIDVAPQPTVPAVTILLIAAGAFVLANVVAAVPGRHAADTPTALLLRAD